VIEPFLRGIGDVHGLALFQRRYERCTCKGWEEFWDHVDEGKNLTVLILKGRSHHLRRCPHNPNANPDEEND
jgi:hypothetical protein